MAIEKVDYSLSLHLKETLLPSDPVKRERRIEQYKTAAKIVGAALGVIAIISHLALSHGGVAHFLPMHGGALVGLERYVYLATITILICYMATSALAYLNKKRLEKQNQELGELHYTDQPLRETFEMESIQEQQTHELEKESVLEEVRRLIDMVTTNWESIRIRSLDSKLFSLPIKG